jgi:hypothetical protein
MEMMMEAHELARRFNEDEAGWRCYERKRTLRKWLERRPPFSEHVLDYLDCLDWLAAKRASRMVRAVGFFLPATP